MPSTDLGVIFCSGGSELRKGRVIERIANSKDFGELDCGIAVSEKNRLIFPLGFVTEAISGVTAGNPPGGLQEYVGRYQR